jgi:hypothetical protein
MGRLLRRVVIWPIPPAYARPAAAAVLLTAGLVALARVHSASGVLAALLGATIVVFLSRKALRARARAE